MEDDGVKDRMEDFFGGLPFEDLRPGDGLRRSKLQERSGKWVSGRTYDVDGHGWKGSAHRDGLGER